MPTLIVATKQKKLCMALEAVDLIENFGHFNETRLCIQ